MPAAPKTASADKKAKVAKKEEKLPAVPESKLKATKAKVIARPGSLRRRHQLQTVKLLRRRQNLLRAAKYTKKYARMEREVVEKAREANKAGNIYIPAEPKVAFVRRIHGINKVAPKVRKVLQLFRLRQINPYITYGYPLLKSIRNLIYKRGFVKHRHSRIPITDNFVIERKLLAAYKRQCVQDLEYQIYTAGPLFRKVNNFLWPFKLNTPTGGWCKKNNYYVEGGEFGNHVYKIKII